MDELEKAVQIDWQMMSPAVKQTIWSGGATIVAAWLGRLAYHAQLVRLGQRRFWSPDLAMELLLATAIGFFADGVLDYFAIHGKASTAGIIAASYLGPRGIEHLIARFGARYLPAPKEPKP